MPEEKKDPKSILADAIQRRDELNTFIRIMQEMLGEGQPTSATHAPLPGATGSEPIQTGDVSDPLSVVYPGMFFGKSQPNAAKALLDRVKRPMKLKPIIECLQKGGCTVGGKNPVSNMWSVLSRNEDVFVMVPKAGWGLVDWYEPSVLSKMRREG